MDPEIKRKLDKKATEGRRLRNKWLSEHPEDPLSKPCIFELGMSQNPEPTCRQSQGTKGIT